MTDNAIFSHDGSALQHGRVVICPSLALFEEEVHHIVMFQFSEVILANVRVPEYRKI